MGINRNNYEAFFILYMDNELNPAERLEVEEFVQKHPDLQEELELLQQTKLFPEENIVFEEKSLLIKDENGISLAEYEEELLLYVDGELTGERKYKVEELAATNPAIQQELSLLLQTRLQPEHISFPEKASLFRTEQGTVVRFTWWRVAAAAVLVLAIGGLIYTYTGTNTSTDEVTVAVKPEIKENDNEPKNSEEKLLIPEDLAASPQGSNTDQKKTFTRGNVIPEEARNSVEKIQKTIAKDEEIIAATQSQQADAGFSAVDAVNERVNPKAMNEFTAPNQNLVKGQDISFAAVTNIQSDPLDNSDASNKRVRGFLRKATRVFERTTKIAVTDEDDRLLIAGLAVKL